MTMTSTPSTPDHPNLPAVNSTESGLTERQLHRIPAWKVFDATKSLPEEHCLAIRWLHSHYYDSGKSLSDIGAEIGYDAGTVSKVFNNNYGGNLAEVVKSIRRFRSLIDERASVNRAPYIKTNLYREIEDCCQAALTYQKIVFLYGESQVGKTAALTHYAEEHNHGQTIMVTMPVGGSLTHFLAALAGKVRMTNCARGEILAMNIMKCFGPNNLLIIDETSRALNAKAYGGVQLKTMDFIRDLHDQTGCGVVLCGTNIFRDQMADRSLKKFLNQFNRRALLRRQLPDVPSRADLNAFARHYDLPAAAGDAFTLQQSIVREHGLGVWLTTLMAAAKKSSKERKPMTWDHVAKAHAYFKRLEEPSQGEE